MVTTTTSITVDAHGNPVSAMTEVIIPKLNKSFSEPALDKYSDKAEGRPCVSLSSLSLIITTVFCHFGYLYYVWCRCCDELLVHSFYLFLLAPWLSRAFPQLCVSVRGVVVVQQALGVFCSSLLLWSLVRYFIGNFWLVVSSVFSSMSLLRHMSTVKVLFCVLQMRGTVTMRCGCHGEPTIIM